VERAKEYHSRSLWSETDFDESKIILLADQLILNGGVFLNDCGGFIAGTIVEPMFSSKVRIATELAWYAPNGGGRLLRDSFEDWAKNNGASIIQLSAMNTENLKNVHENLELNGFSLAELNYVKRLV
jgi:hypothetical protein